MSIDPLLTVPVTFDPAAVATTLSMKVTLGISVLQLNSAFSFCTQLPKAPGPTSERL